MDKPLEEGLDAYLGTAVWLIIHSLKHNDTKSMVRAAELLKEKNINHIQIMQLCVLTYRLALADVEDMMRKKGLWKGNSN